MNQRKRRIRIALFFLLLVLIGPPVWMTYQEMRQARLDHALIAAIKARDNEKTLDLLTEGANGEARDTGKPPTFCEALLHLWDRVRHPGNRINNDKHLPALLVLYQQTSKTVTIKNSQMYAVLAMPDPSLSVVQALLDHGAKVNDRDENGNSPLHYASCCPKDDNVRLLLTRGANIEAKGINGATPLFWANAVNTQALLRHGANIEARNDKQETPLIWSVLAFDPPNMLKKVQILLEHGAKVSAKDRLGQTALVYTEAYLHGVSDPDHHKVKALLITYGAK